MLVPRRVFKPTGGSFKYIRLSTLSLLLYPKLHPNLKCFPPPAVTPGAGARSRKAVGIGKIGKSMVSSSNSQCFFGMGQPDSANGSP